MKVTTYALMAATGLAAAAATVPATAQQSDQKPLPVTMTTGHCLNLGTLIVSPFSFPMKPEQARRDDHRDDTINREPVKLEPVHIVVSREPSPSRGKE